MGDKSLENRTAFVTGSVQGIGLAVAKSLASAGANVALHGLATPDQAKAGHCQRKILNS